MSIVYRHRRLDTFEVFYIGIGKTEKRAYSKKNRNKWWKNIILKTEYSVEIIIEDISWKEAQEVEVLLISEYGRRDLGLGNLVNLTNGGEGTQGMSEVCRIFGHSRKGIIRKLDNIEKNDTNLIRV